MANRRRLRLAVPGLRRHFVSVLGERQFLCLVFGLGAMPEPPLTEMTVPSAHGKRSFANFLAAEFNDLDHLRPFCRTMFETCLLERCALKLLAIPA
jgi:hypothetical protein